MRRPHTTHGSIRDRLSAAGNYAPFDVDSTLIGLVDTPPEHVLVETTSDEKSTTWRIQWLTETDVGEIIATAPEPVWNRYSDPIEGQKITASMVPLKSIDRVTFAHEAAAVTQGDVHFILKGTLVAHHSAGELLIPPLGMSSTPENQVSEFQTAFLTAWRKHQR